jgi:hypothetical protein
MIPTRSLDDVLRRALAHFRTSFKGYPLGSKRFLGRVARALGLVAWGLQKSIEYADRDAVPSPQTSTDRLTEWATLLGLPDAQGGYGRLAATTASGGLATLTGVIGTIYPANAVATAEDGTTQIALVAQVTIAGSPPGYGSIQGAFVALTRGSVGNLPAGTVMTWASPPTGADQTFTLSSPLSDGLDVEDNPSVYARIVSRLQEPANGSAASDYRKLAEAVPTCARAFVYAQRSGTGSCDVVVTAGGSGQGRAVGPVAAVQTAIDGARPCCENNVTAMDPSMPNGNGLLVRLRVVAAPGNGWDWGDSTAYTVDAYTPGSAPLLRLTGLAPADLKAAIAAYKAGHGSAPRLQVLSTGSVINPPIRAVDYSDGGGKTTLTLETVPAGWQPPTAADAVYHYGPIVATIAAGALALCDALGPSRASGFADALDAWNDTLTISGLIRVAEDAIGSDGAKLISEVVVGGATINGSGADVKAQDVASAPAMLYLSHVAVTA